MENNQILYALSEALRGIAEGTAQGVVCIQLDGGLWRTGILLDAQHILTVARQAEEGDVVNILSSDGREHPAGVAGYDAERELAVLSLDSSVPGKPLTVQEQFPRVGELCITVAYPSPEGPEARLGMIRCVAEGKEGGGRYFQTDSTVFPGFAGSAVLDVEGRLLGVTALSSGPVSGYVIPASDAMAAARQLIRSGSPKYGYLGVRTFPVELPRGIQTESGRQKSGLLVMRIEPESPAEKAGLLLGDTLLSLGGAELPDHSALIRTLAAESGGKAINMEVLRAGKRLSLEVTPELRSESMSRRQSGTTWQHGRWNWHGRHHHR